MRGLRGKVIVVAGAGTGIGASVAERLGEEGAEVVVGDINETNAKATAERVVDAGGTATATVFDAIDEESVKQLIASTVETYGRLDGLHANVADMAAKTHAEDGDAVTVPLDLWERVMSVNLRGHLFLARAAIPELLKAGGGSLVFTSSGAAFAGEPSRLAYAASKAGVNALMRHVARRWGAEGIRANAVAPGVVLTESGIGGTTEELRGMVKLMLPSPRHGEPEDIAAMVTLLLSGDGAWINGQCIGIDGGLSMR